MNKVLLVLVLLVLGAGAYYYFVMLPRQEAAGVTESPLIPPKPETPPTAPSDQAPPASTEPDPGLEPAIPEVPLPPLEQSDPDVLQQLTSLIGEPAVKQYVTPENVIGRIVVTLDSITARQLPGQLLPVQPPDTPFEANVDAEPPEEITNEQGDVLQQYVMDPVNANRYSTYVQLLESVDTYAIVGTYHRYEPLFEKAYVDQGYPEGGFKNRLLEVIDHLLAAPPAPESIRLVKPEAYYLFTDPELENLTAGQKLMVRMGSDNARRVKEKLQEIRAALEGDPAQQTARQANQEPPRQ